ncbi:MAG: DUF1292 domain-containing protein [Firmicutes bacterium]|nr:DUF1292 domain-containing protein [Bacillota bacterium]
MESNDKLNIDEFNFFEGQEEVYELITMVDDDGKEQDYYVMDGIDVEKVRYLLVVKAEDFEKEEPDAYLFKEVNSDDKECIYEPVEDDDEYSKVILLLQDENADYDMEF